METSRDCRVRRALLENSLALPFANEKDKNVCRSCFFKRPTFHYPYCFETHCSNNLNILLWDSTARTSRKRGELVCFHVFLPFSMFLITHTESIHRQKRDRQTSYLLSRPSSPADYSLFTRKKHTNRSFFSSNFTVARHTWILFVRIRDFCEKREKFRNFKFPF